MGKRVSFLSLLFTIGLYAQQERLEIIGSLTHDFYTHPSGGLETGSGVMGTINLASMLVLWDHGYFFGQSIYNYGPSLSATMGDLQVANNIEAMEGWKMYELWYQHSGESWSITVGQQDVNSHFAASDYGQHFINSSFGISPELTVNFPLSTFPATSLGGVIGIQWNSQLSFRLGVFDGHPGWDTQRPWKERLRWNTQGGTFGIAEWEFQGKSNHKLGLWQHRTSHSQSSLQGLYLVGDVPLFTSDSQSREMGMFYQLGFSGPSAPLINQYLGFGLVVKGLIPTVKDRFGIGYARAQLSNMYRQSFAGLLPSAEQIIEFTYHFPLTSWIQLQPNFQYVVHPATDVGISNAVLWMLRVQIGE